MQTSAKSSLTTPLWHCLDWQKVNHLLSNVRGPLLPEESCVFWKSHHRSAKLANSGKVWRMTNMSVARG